MNQDAQRLVCDFYNSEEILDDMIRLTGEYYFGGNNVPFTAGQIVDLLKSKYK